MQGLITNDVQQLKTVGDVLPAVLLTTKGRVLAPSILYLKSTADTGDSILVELHKKNLSEIQRYLTMYRLRSKVTIKPIDLQCTMQLRPIESESTHLISTVDPRYHALGTRVLENKTGWWHLQRICVEQFAHVLPPLYCIAQRTAETVPKRKATLHGTNGTSWCMGLLTGRSWPIASLWSATWTCCTTSPSTRGAMWAKSSPPGPNSK